MARYGQRESRENAVIIKMNHDLKLMGPAVRTRSILLSSKAIWPWNGQPKHLQTLNEKLA